MNKLNNLNFISRCLNDWITIPQYYNDSVEFKVDSKAYYSNKTGKKYDNFKSTETYATK